MVRIREAKGTNNYPKIELPRNINGVATEEHRGGTVAWAGVGHRPCRARPCPAGIAAAPFIGKGEFEGGAKTP